MSFTSKDVMELRAKTGVGMMDCKKALVESDGDMEKAVEILREKGMATGAKRASKIASQGIVDSYENGNVSVLVEVNCESDFVARGEQFKAFCDEIAKYIADENPANVEEIVSAKADLLNETVAKIGEKIVVRRFVRYVADNTMNSSYIHMGGKIGVLVEMSSNTQDEVAHDIALQIAAVNPSYVNSSEVPAEVIEKEKEINRAQLENEENEKPENKRKPAAVLDKIVEGKIAKYFKEVCLVEQPFVKAGDMTVAQYLKANGDVQVIKFTRFAMGEGLEKKEENLANEVEEQIAKAKAGK